MSAFIAQRTCVQGELTYKTPVVKFVAYTRTSKRSAMAQRLELEKLCRKIGAVSARYADENGRFKPVQDVVFLHVKRESSNGYASEESIQCSAWELHVPEHPTALATLAEYVGLDNLVVDLHLVDASQKVPYPYKRDQFGSKPKVKSHASEPRPGDVVRQYRGANKIVTHYPGY